MNRKKTDPQLQPVSAGHQVTVHYRGTFEDNTEFDNSYERGEPVSFEAGSGQMIKGFDEAVMGMLVGETKKITLTPEHAYGPVIPEARTEVARSHFPEDFEFKAGLLIQGRNQFGQSMVGKIEEVKDESVVLDLNHPMAGKELNFEIELLQADLPKPGQAEVADPENENESEE